MSKQCKSVNEKVSDGVRCNQNEGHKGLHTARLGKTEKTSW